MKRGRPEDLIQEACVEWLAIQENLGRLSFFAVPNGGKRSAATGALLKRTGTRAGVPDMLILYPGGSVHFVEVKPKGRTLSDEQKVWRNRLIEMGFDWFLARSLDDLIAIVDRRKAA